MSKQYVIKFGDKWFHPKLSPGGMVSKNLAKRYKSEQAAKCARGKAIRFYGLDVNAGEVVEENARR